MKIGFYSWYKELNHGRILENIPTDVWGGDRTNLPNFLLANRLRAAGHQVATIDQDDPDSFDRVVFYEYPEHRLSGEPNRVLRHYLARRHSHLYLVLMESPAIKPNNWRRDLHAPFRNIFTWHAGFVDGSRYLRVHTTSHPASDMPRDISRPRSGFAALVARQKTASLPCELYSARLKLIRWAEAHRPGMLDLYGDGWDRPIYSGALSLLNWPDEFLRRASRHLPRPLSGVVAASARFSRLCGGVSRLGAPVFPSWKGRANTIRSVLERYRFSICYENSSFPGWITERLFDSFMAGSVPVYLGDPQIEERVPPSCYVDARPFSDEASLWDCLESLNDSDLNQFRRCAIDFLNSSAAQAFTAEHFASTLFDCLTSTTTSRE